LARWSLSIGSAISPSFNSACASALVTPPTSLEPLGESGFDLSDEAAFAAAFAFPS
jgi:hypothetical protein